MHSEQKSVPRSLLPVYAYVCVQAMPATCIGEWRTLMGHHEALRNLSGLDDKMIHK